MFNLTELKMVHDAMSTKTTGDKERISACNDPDYVEAVAHEIADDECLLEKIVGLIADNTFEHVCAADCYEEDVCEDTLYEQTRIEQCFN